jgi:hypothetical protein
MIHYFLFKNIDKIFKMNRENSEIFSPDDLNQFQFSPSDKRISTQPIAADLETEPTVPKESTTEKVAVPKTSEKRGPRGPYKTKPKQ